MSLRMPLEVQKLLVVTPLTDDALLDDADTTQLHEALEERKRWLILGWSCGLLVTKTLTQLRVLQALDMKKKMLG
ncbi:unnamed protein product [Lathyrus sativus]|nr:unnamed protein product [Lathyrus sativus]